MSGLRNIDIINKILKNQINVLHLLIMMLQYDNLRN